MGSDSVEEDAGTVRVITSETEVRLLLRGEIDATLTLELADATALAVRECLPIIVDVGQVEFMDSTGVAFLARLATRAPHGVRLVNVTATVRFLLEVTQIGGLVEVDEKPAVSTQVPLLGPPAPQSPPDITA